MTKRFKRYLFDGGFSFGEEYVLPKWSISDENTKGSPFGFLEFDDEHKDLCDEIVDSLNEFVDEYNHLKEEKEQLKKRLDEVLKELYCKDRKLEELGEDIRCCDEK